MTRAAINPLLLALKTGIISVIFLGWRCVVQCFITFIVETLRAAKVHRTITMQLTDFEDKYLLNEYL